MNLQEQLKAVKSTWDNWNGRIPNGKELILEGNVQPTIVSPIYKIKITYKEGGYPFVKVVSPELKLYPGKESLPHVNSHPDNPLCLFLYEFNSRNDALAETIIKWITWWLFFYEIWAETGEWTGGGTHPTRW
ncbi:hypothetical protein [uncultured Draconibacterium sp.]|uniref:hypothetical protein n=1 Tax=uncultured Draconibacterium sp. TaxID=1573823 RepID=UPI003217881D